MQHPSPQPPLPSSPDPSIYIVLNPATDKTLRCRPADFSPVPDPKAKLALSPPPKCAGARRSPLHVRLRVPATSMLRSLLPVLTLAHLAASAHTSPLAYHTNTTYKNPKHLADALRRSDASYWARTNDKCIDRNLRLGAWLPVPTNKIPAHKLSTPRWQYKYKTLRDGTVEKRSARCTVRGDLMLPHIHHDPTKTSAQTPLYAAQHLFCASAALNGNYIEK